ncbi:hypothetical protein BH09VER1_BH09VER1_15000 [soil metagenome]
MLLSLKRLYGQKLDTSDGEVGHVKDFYFDDRQWKVRYVVADTGNWLRGRLVLISPHAFGALPKIGDPLLVNLTLQQIENGPQIESHKPISRQYEDEYFRYYGYPTYWREDATWGTKSLPAGLPFQVLPITEQQLAESSDDDLHLRSSNAITDYEVATSGGDIGHVTDFLMDDKSWQIRYLVIETGHWYSGKEIVISPKDVDQISYEDSAVTLNLTRESILKAPEYHALPLDTQGRPEIVKAPSANPIPQGKNNH